jgi:transposase
MTQPPKRERIGRDEVERLRRENEQLRRENEELRKEKESIEKEKEAVEKDLETVRKEFDEYKARHPENVGVKNGKAYAVKPPAPPGPRKRPGARPGHKPHYRKAPEHIDDVEGVPVHRCPHCGNEELSEVQEIRERTVEDIPTCKPVVTQYLIERRYCKRCSGLVETPVTAALPKARLGLRVMLATVYLKVGMRLPVEAIPKILKTLFGIHVSEGEVICILDQVAEAFGDYYDQLVKTIREAPARHMDETSWRIDGQNVWLWAFVTKGEALYLVANSRGHEVPLGVLGTEPKGVDIHDRLSVYDTLASKTGNRPQQYCWGHIICDAKELAKFHGEDGEVILRILKKTYVRAMEFDHKGTEADVEALFHHMKGDLDRQYKSKKCQRFVSNLLKDKAGLFVFVTNPDVEATNNAAERALRHPVVARKISGGSRSAKGAKVFGTLMSVVQSFKQSGKDLLVDGPVVLNTSHG